MIDTDLASLCQEALDGTISDVNLALLENELLKNPKSLQQYINFARLHNSLDLVHTLHTSSSLLAEASVVPVERIIQRQKRKTIKLVVLATAALVLLSISILSFLKSDSNEPPLVFKSAPGTEYTLSHSSDLKDTPEGLILMKGSNLIISQGTVELTFKSGVKSILQAPANVTLRADDSLYMHEGTAWFEVSSGAEGFKVNTSQLNIVDLGTEFGVIANPKNLDEIHVLKGKVKASAVLHKKQSAILSIGEARRIDPVGRLEIIPLDDSLFITELPSFLPYVHWSFDRIEEGQYRADGNHHSLELASAKPPKFNIQNLVTKGRFGEAVRFTGIKGQQLHTLLPGIEGNAPRTTACWVRTTHIPKVGGSDIAGLIGWGYCNDDNKRTRSNTIWKQFIAPNGVLSVIGGGSYVGTTKITDGKWHHLACVMTPSKKAKGGIQLTLYVDGVKEGEIVSYHVQPTNTLTQRSDSTPVRFGCSIHKPNTPPIVYRGDIDEVYLFYGALDQTAIQNLMRNNNPTAN